MNPTHRNRIGLVVALLAVLPLMPRVQAQEGDRGYTHAHSRFDVDFPGGKLSEYVDAVRRARPDGAANIVVMPNAENLAIPPITLVGITVEAAIKILEGPYEMSDGRGAEVQVWSHNIGDSPDLVMKVVAELEFRSVRSAVWSVEEALASGQTAEELLGAVEAVVSLFNEKADISFHPPTRLLIARGTDEQLDLVREALDQLIHGATRRNQELSSIHRQIEELERDQYRVTAETDVARKEVEVAGVYLDKMIRNLKAEAASQEDVAQYELEVTRAKAELMMYEHELHSIAVGLKRLKEGLKRYETSKE